jgi:hypothetical protein
MSKTINLLNEIQSNKTNKYSAVMNKIEGVVSWEEESSQHKINKSVFIYVLAFCLFGFCSVFYMRFLLTSELDKQKQVFITKLNNIELTLSRSNALGAGLTTELKQAKSQISAYGAKISGLKNELAAQKTAIDNLSKANNTLFKRVSELEATHTTETLSALASDK